jgi:hypothetical protein
MRFSDSDSGFELVFDNYLWHFKASLFFPKSSLEKVELGKAVLFLVKHELVIMTINFVLSRGSYRVWQSLWGP